jgi:leucyl-tRNA synthetase
VRLFSVSDSPANQSLEWSESGVEGASRFLRRLWSLVQEHAASGPCPPLDVSALNAEQKEIRRRLHDTIAKVSDDISRRYTFNTAIAAVMELTNLLARYEDESTQARAVLQEAWQAVVRLLAPISPHICEVLWEMLGGATPVSLASWPVVDEAAREKSQVTLVVQVNGKLRGKLELEPGAPQEAALEHAMALENVRRHIGDKSVRKVIHVPDRLLNIVVG